MERLYIQIKSSLKDKMSILSFILPILMAILLNFITVADIGEVADIRFGIVRSKLSVEIENKLDKLGIVSIFDSMESLEYAIKNPSDELIGIVGNDKEIEEVLISGDETIATKTYAKNILNTVNFKDDYRVEKLPSVNYLLEFKNLLYTIVIIMAIFIGCTFNSMNIVGEKEDGTINIYSILPMTDINYIKQKTLLGFILSIILSILTTIFCINNILEFMLIAIIAIFASFLTSVLGMIIGKISNDLIIAISYIKIFMIILLTIPIIVFLFLKDSIYSTIFYIIPSYPVFLGIINALDKNYKTSIINIFITLAYSILIIGIYIIFKNLKLESQLTVES